MKRIRMSSQASGTGEVLSPCFYNNQVSRRAASIIHIRPSWLLGARIGPLGSPTSSIVTIVATRSIIFLLFPSKHHSGKRIFQFRSYTMTKGRLDRNTRSKFKKKPYRIKG